MKFDYEAIARSFANCIYISGDQSGNGFVESTNLAEYISPEATEFLRQLGRKETLAELVEKRDELNRQIADLEKKKNV